jgi:hypothetical protein
MALFWKFKAGKRNFYGRQALIAFYVMYNTALMTRWGGMGMGH